MKVNEATLTCPNGHTRKFFASYTSVAWKVEDGVGKPLGDTNSHIVLYHCADCGATLAYEVNGAGDVVEEQVKA